MKRSALKRTRILRRRRAALRPGKQTKANRASNARLKIKFAGMGITRCELNYPGCTRDDFLSWAHGRKRRKLQGDELDTLVCLACINCHEIAERKSPEEMLAIVQGVIADRELKAA